MKQPPRPARPARVWTIAGLILAVALLAALVAVLGAHLAGGSAGEPPATATIDPRLVLHPRHVPISGTLAGGTLSGNLYPGLPGPNTIELHASPPTQARHLDLVATMPGMQMVPARARLTLRHGAYRGTVALPMFGGYLARLSVVGSDGITGTVRLLVPLALGQ